MGILVSVRCEIESGMSGKHESTMMHDGIDTCKKVDAWHALGC